VPHSKSGKPRLVQFSQLSSSEWLRRRRRLSWLSLAYSIACLGTAFSVCISDFALAQITPDATLPRRSITQSRNRAIVITGGTQVGTNLFHSFQQFSVPVNRTASFQSIDPATANILVRVTGRSTSHINGAIEALQLDGSLSSANLFLLNPNGITFGTEASLNLGGSFFATTADRLNFADNTAFSAVNPSSLLTVSVPVGLQFGRSPAGIRAEAGANLTLETPDSPVIGGLQVPAGKTLALIGGRVTLRSALLRATAGRVELGAIGQTDGSSQVSLNPSASGWRLGYGQIERFDTLTLTEGALVSASGNGAGSIQIRGDRVDITDAFVIANTLGNADGGKIQIGAEDLRINGGAIIGSLSAGGGQAAAIQILTDRLRMQDGGQVAIVAYGTGQGRDLTVTATDSVTVTGGTIADRVWEPSGLINQVTETAKAQGGNLRITTPSLSILNGAQINTTTSGAGDAGAIEVRATTIALDGVALQNNGRLFAPQDLPIGSGLFSGTERGSSGSGGSLRLTTDHLQISAGAVLQTTTFGSGNAGTLRVNAARVEVRGTDPEGRFPSSIIAASGGIPGLRTEGVAAATGRGGTLRLHTQELQIADGAAIAVGSLNPDETQAQGAGSAQIWANRVHLSDRGSILSETASGNGGNITLNVPMLLLLSRNSRISTNAGSSRTGGDGGNIAIDAGYIVTGLTDNSDITANAFTGTGGDVQINADGVLGIEPRQQQTRLSDITASSELGTSGTIRLNAPTFDPTRGLVNLPTEVVNLRLDQRCRATRQPAAGQFLETGRSGLPIAPSQAEERLVWEDLRFPGRSQVATTVSPLPTAALPSPDTQVSEAQVLEAQGWVRESNGAVVLTAESQTVIPYGSWLTPAACTTSHSETSHSETSHSETSRSDRKIRRSPH